MESVCESQLRFTLQYFSVLNYLFSSTHCSWMIKTMTDYGLRQLFVTFLRIDRPNCVLTKVTRWCEKHKWLRGVTNCTTRVKKVICKVKKLFVLYDSTIPAFLLYLVSTEKALLLFGARLVSCLENLEDRT